MDSGGDGRVSELIGEGEFLSPRLGSSNSATSSPRKEREWKIQALTGKGIVRLPDAGGTGDTDKDRDSKHVVNDSKGDSESDSHDSGKSSASTPGGAQSQRNDWKVKALTGRGLLSCDDMEKAKKADSPRPRSHSSKELSVSKPATAASSCLQPTPRQLDVISPRSNYLQEDSNKGKKKEKKQKKHENKEELMSPRHKGTFNSYGSLLFIYSFYWALV